MKNTNGQTPATTAALRSEASPALSVPLRLELIPPSIPPFLDEAPIPPENKRDDRLYEHLTCEDLEQEWRKGGL